METLNNLNNDWIKNKESLERPYYVQKLRKKAVEWIKNLQYKNTEYSIVLDKFPDNMKGKLAKDKWNDTIFRYGAEYGMISWIKHFFNLSESDLK